MTGPQWLGVLVAIIVFGAILIIALASVIVGSRADTHLLDQPLDPEREEQPTGGTDADLSRRVSQAGVVGNLNHRELS